MLAKKQRAVNWILTIVYLVSFVPWVEILSAIAKALDKFYVSWNYWAMFIGSLTMEIDITFYTRIQKTDIWLKKVEPLINKIIFMIKSVFGTGSNKPKAPWRLYLEKLLVRLEYLGLLIGASIPGFGLGKVVSLIFATSKQKFRYGRILLYLGCILRVYIIYYFYDQFF